jgi:hypothetical protein
LKISDNAKSSLITNKWVFVVVENQNKKVINDDLVVSHSEYSLIKRGISENMKLSELISQFISTNDIYDNYEQNPYLHFS